MLAVAAGMLAAVTGCATKGTPYATPSSQSPSATSAATAPTATTGPLPTASMTPLPAAAGQLTGTELASVLLPASDFPAGFTASSSGATNSGGSLTSGPAQYPLATISCSDFVQHLGSTGFGETGMAADSIAGTDQAYDQAVYQFSSACGGVGVRGRDLPARGPVPVVLRAGERQRHHHHADEGHAGRFRRRPAHGRAVADRDAPDGSALTLDTLFTASGVDVFVVSAVGLGTGAPAVPAKETIIYNLMKRQAAAAELG